MGPALHIGEVAHLLGVTQKTIRHYHKVGLLAEPARSQGGYRLYTTSDLRRVLRIRRLQALGLSLKQIKGITERLEASFGAIIGDLILGTLSPAQRRFITLIQRRLDQLPEEPS